MAPPVPESQLTLPQLFTELQKYVHKSDFKNIVKFSNLILHAKGRDYSSLNMRFAYIGRLHVGKTRLKTLVRYLTWSLSLKSLVLNM